MRCQGNGVNPELKAIDLASSPEEETWTGHKIGLKSWTGQNFEILDVPLAEL